MAGSPAGEGVWRRPAEATEAEKNAEPPPLALGAQSVENAATATESIGFDGGKLSTGRRRFVRNDASGATVAARDGSAASAPNGQSAWAGWAGLRRHPLLQRVKRLFIDGGFWGECVEQTASLDGVEGRMPQEVVRQAGNIRVHATHRVVERTSGWITNHRGLARSYEHRTYAVPCVK